MSDDRLAYSSNDGIKIIKKSKKEETPKKIKAIKNK